MESDFEFLCSEIRNGSIRSWFEMEMKMTMMGMDVDSKFMDKFLGMSMEFKFYRIFRNAFLKCDVLDSFFENGSLVETLILKEGDNVYDLGSWKVLKFEGLKMLRELDMRNPRVLLRYFLNHPSPSSKTDQYLSLLWDITKRTELRAKIKKPFEKYVDILKNLYEEKTSMFQTMK